MNGDSWMKIVNTFEPSAPPSVNYQRISFLFSIKVQMQWLHFVNIFLQHNPLRCKPTINQDLIHFVSSKIFIWVVNHTFWERFSWTTQIIKVTFKFKWVLYFLLFLTARNIIFFFVFIQGKKFTLKLHYLSYLWETFYWDK